MTARHDGRSVAPPSAYQESRGGRERTAHGGDTEYGRAGQEELFAPEPVSEVPEGNEERADDEPVDVENP